MTTTTTTVTVTVTVTTPGSIASPWVLQSVPEPGSPFPPSTKFIVVGAIVIKISSEKPVSKIFLVSELHFLFRRQDVSVLLVLTNLVGVIINHHNINLITNDIDSVVSGHYHIS